MYSTRDHRPPAQGVAVCTGAIEKKKKFLSSNIKLTKLEESCQTLEQMRSQANNKKSESYPAVLSYPLEIREEGKRNRTDNKAVKCRKRIERRKLLLSDSDRRKVRSATQNNNFVF